jgi:hypothetical protein
MVARVRARAAPVDSDQSARSCVCGMLDTTGSAAALDRSRDVGVGGACFMRKSQATPVPERLRDVEDLPRAADLCGDSRIPRSGRPSPVPVMASAALAPVGVAPRTRSRRPRPAQRSVPDQSPSPRARDCAGAPAPAGVLPSVGLLGPRAWAAWQRMRLTRSLPARRADRRVDHAIRLATTG